MKTLLLTFAALLIASTCSADAISLYSSTNGDDVCMGPAPPAPTLVSVWVIHEGTAGTSGSKWKVNNNSGLFVIGGQCGDGLNIQIVGGDPFNGIELGYASCEAGRVNLCRLDFMNFGALLPECYQLQVVGFPGEASPLAYDCNLSSNTAGGGFFTFSGWPGADDQCWDCTIAVEPTTWGSVKALYR